MNLLILDAGHSFDTKGKNNVKENFYEWEFNNDVVTEILELQQYFDYIED